MPRKVWIPIAAVAALVLIGAGGAYAYFFSGLRASPPALALASPSASPSAAAASPTASATTIGGAGTWTIASGSVIGYRVNEQFAGQSSSHEAVARTSEVTGQVAITRTAGAYEMTSASITVRLAGLASVDTVAGYNVTNRDRIVQQSLGVGSFPSATFAAQPVTLPSGADTGQTVTVSVPGQLTIHGVTKSVTATIQLRVSGTTAQIAGSIATNMTEFGISPPTIGFTTVQPAVTIDFLLNLTQGS
ncbi:MAG TPA: YceI family protein [Candidatus Limnocylindrales bacterium]|nr:YceI family protein [Candidatus Limnocylindrales bacterium]